MSSSRTSILVRRLALPITSNFACSACANCTEHSETNKEFRTSSPPIVAALNRLEPISKAPEEDDEAGELNKAQEILGMVLPADEDSALHLAATKECDQEY